MPFTATHIAAAIPIAWMARWQVPFSALAIGCMVPDAGVFFPMLFDYESLHSVKGLFVDCVPIGVAAYFVFHLLIKQPAVELLPGPLRKRLRPIADRPFVVTPASIAIVAACVLAGAATHVFWDSFTHRGRWGSTIAVPALSNVAFTTSGRDVQWFAVSQHLSSLFFLPPLGLYAFRVLWRQPIVANEPKRTRIPDWISMTVVAVGALLMLGHFAWVHGNHSNYGIAFALRRSVMIFGAVAILVLTVYSIVMHTLWARSEEQT